MLHSKLEVAEQEVCVPHDSIINMITGASQADSSHRGPSCVPVMTPRAKGYDSSAARRSQKV